MARNLILCSDLHLRGDKPVRRIDDYWAAQEKKLKHIAAYARALDAPVLCAGDVFHRWNPHPRTITLFMSIFKEIEFYCVPGQHDLPNHDLSRYENTGLRTIDEMDNVHVISDPNNHVCLPFTAWVYGFPVDVEPFIPKKRVNCQVALCHRMTWLNKPFPGASPKGNVIGFANDMLGHYDLIVTGDNHQPFRYTVEDKITIVNPGSMMRMTIAQTDHLPRIYIWNSETGNTHKEFLPTEDNVFSEEDPQGTTTATDFTSFVDVLEKTQTEMSLSFAENMRIFLKTHKVGNRIEKLIEEICHEQSGS